VPDPSQPAWIRPFWPGKGQISARTAGFGQPVRIQLFWPANERFPARMTETAGSGQLARIQLIWPGNEQILASWQRQGRPALQILRCSCRPFRSLRPELHSPAGKREEELDREKERALVENEKKKKKKKKSKRKI
jgi:hypothetical protein